MWKMLTSNRPNLAAGARASGGLTGGSWADPDCADSGGRSKLLIEAAGLSALMLAAAALRLVHLADIPSPTDELLSVARALEISRGHLLPLTDFEPYIGALWCYILAAGFVVAGPNAELPRLITLVVGSLLVPATYLLARELAGRRAAWLAAGLVAVSSAQAVASSHPAWSHALVPLFITLAFWRLERSLRLDRPGGLLGAAFWLGLALQAHLTALAFVPGVVLTVLTRQRRWLGTRWPYLAALLAVALIGNLIAFNLQSGFASIRRAQMVQDAYARPKGSGWELYAGNARRMGLATTRTISGAIDVRDDPADYLRDPMVLLATALAVIGALILTRGGRPLPIWAVAPYLLMLLVFNAKYEVIPNARFLMPVLPFAAACVGTALAALQHWQPFGHRFGVGLPALVLTMCLLSAESLVGLARRYDQMVPSAATTRGVIRAVDAVAAARDSNEPILLDRNLDRLWLDGGGDVFMALNYELQRRELPHDELPGRLVPRTGDLNPCDRATLLAVRIDRTVESPAWLAPGLEPEPGRVPLRFWTFHAIPRLTRPEPLAPNEQIVLQYLAPLNGSARAVDRCAPGRLI